MERWRAELYHDELYHHGVKGMKWGVRRYQNRDGSYTAAGKRRYFNGDSKKKSTAKTSSKGKSKTIQKWEKQYRDKGLSEKDAELAAQKRAKTMKAIAIVGGIAIASVAAYAGYQYYKDHADTIIKAGTTLQRISTNSDIGVKDAFYASFKNSDNKYYAKHYTEHLKGEGANVFKKMIDVNSDMKIASRENQFKQFKDFMSDKETASAVRDRMFNEYMGTWDDAHEKVLRKGVHDLKAGKITKNVYDGFNTTLASHHNQNEGQDKLVKEFYQKIKDAGYDGLMDINDQKYGYKTKKPIIVFDNKKKLKVSSVTKL